MHSARFVTRYVSKYTKEKYTSSLHLLGVFLDCDVSTIPTRQPEEIIENSEFFIDIWNS